jgi:hypothetical protein
VWDAMLMGKGDALLMGVEKHGGLLDIFTARYFYKASETILHKPTANSGINIFYNKCSCKHYLQLL